MQIGIFTPFGIPGKISGSEPIKNPKIIKYVGSGYFSIAFSIPFAHKRLPTITPIPKGIKGTILNVSRAAITLSYSPNIKKSWETLIPGRINPIATMAPPNI